MNEVLGVKYNVGDLLKEKEIHREIGKDTEK